MGDIACYLGNYSASLRKGMISSYYVIINPLSQFYYADIYLIDYRKEMRYLLREE